MLIQAVLAAFYVWHIDVALCLLNVMSDHAKLSDHAKYASWQTEVTFCH